MPNWKDDIFALILGKLKTVVRCVWNVVGEFLNEGDGGEGGGRV